LKYNDYTDDDDSDHFVDFGLIQVSEKTEEDLDDRAWLKRFTSAPESVTLLQLSEDKDEESANATTVLFHNGKAMIVPATQKLTGESPRLAQPLNFMILSLD